MESEGDQLPSIVNDFTVEAAVLMMENIGHIIDKKLRSLQALELIAE